jgi:hypothetical protein
VKPTHPTGHQWLDTFMRAQAMVEANTLWLAFVLGQIGAQPADNERLIEMIQAARRDVDDLEEAVRRLAGVTRDMLANAERHASGA